MNPYIPEPVEASDDTENDSDSRILIESVLHQLNDMFDCEAANIDTKVGNASRISKVYGTTVRKGENSAEHPWRIARLLDTPKKWRSCPKNSYRHWHVRKRDKAKNCLRHLLKLHKYAPIVVTAILGAPAYARWHNSERFGVALWGETGTLKTTFCQATMAAYGTDYLDDVALLKHGKVESTPVGASGVFARAGILMQLLDNVKAIDEKDSQHYVALTHTVLESAGKAKGTKGEA